MQDTAPAELLAAALEATAVALEAGDAGAAATASSQAAAASEALQASGQSIDPAQAERLGALQARCEAAASLVSRKLEAEMSVAAKSTRAEAAYRR